MLTAHNSLDCVELVKLHDLFIKAKRGGRDTYIDFDNTEYGNESGGISKQLGGISVKKLTLIIGGGPESMLTPQQVVRGAYAYGRRVQGLPRGVPPPILPDDPATI